MVLLPCHEAATPLSSHEISLRRLTHPMASLGATFHLASFHSTPDPGSSFRHRPGGYILRPSHNCHLGCFIDRHFTPCTQFSIIHDTPRKRDSPAPWFDLLGMSRTFVDFRILLWCVLLSRGTRLIYKFDNRSVSYTLLCINHYLCVRFVRAAYSLPTTNIQKSHRRRGFSRRATAAMFVTTVINFLLFSLNTGIQTATFITVIQKPLNSDIPPLSEVPIPKAGLVRSMSWSMILIAFWAAYLPVSIKQSLSDSVSINIHAR